MAKQLNQVKVNLAFTADTSQAKASLQSLKNDLTSLTNLSAVPMHLPITDKMAEASRAAASLKVQLEQATNVNTGKLDLTKFSISLKQSGLDLEYYRKQLQTLGPQGQKAFLNLASAIQQAEAPLFSINGILKQMGTTLSNTIRWQISSSAIHAFVGGIQTAFGYAEDLNESLNNIRIVTGQSTDQMAKFAKEANKAAKALSTTTTDYTDAALIYYQQGLNDQEVKARTDITVKMANVSRQSAEEVSDQLTAVWNNFYDGSQSLEHYADAMTKLGADTASSSDEIAQGLEKFAAIGDTIGLSFDNAAAALATVTATTRQSADVVGTAFKTIFARIQGLNLGETLDDGTTLNKYSEALSKVGISIFESSGNLKDMDNILAEMGEKWKDLNEDQKTALAQTVAGVRQYTQLIALMDNFDFYEKNLLSAQNADGTLQEQADIYAESWEASSDRVKAAAETIYSALINDKFFISLNDNLAEVLENIGKFIDKLGGAKGIFLTVGMLLTRFANQAIANGIRSVALGIGNIITQGKKEKELRDSMIEQTRVMAADKNITKSQAMAYDSIANSQDLLLKNNKKLSQEEKQRVALLMDRQRVAAENLNISSEELKQQKAILSLSKENLMVAQTQTIGKSLNGTGLENNVSKIQQQVQEYTQLARALYNYQNALANENITEEKSIQLKEAAIAELQRYGVTEKQAQKIVLSSATMNEYLGQSYGNLTISLSDLSTDILKTNKLNESQKNKILSLINTLEREIETTQISSDVILQNARAREIFIAGNEDINKTILGSKGPIKDWANTLTKASGTIMNITMAITQLKSAVDTVRSPDASGWDKFSSVLMAISFTLPAATEGFTLLSSTYKSLTSVSQTLFSFQSRKIKNTYLEIQSNNKLNKGLKSAWVTNKMMAMGYDKATIAAFKQTVAQEGLNEALKKFNISSKLANFYTLAIIAVITALAIAIAKLVGKYKQLETENKQATEDLKNTKQAFDDVNNSISETQNLLDGLGDKYSNIQELEYGTSKWRDAVSDLNNDLTDTLEKYDLLSDASNWYRDSQGVMHLTDQGIEALQKAMDEQQQAMNIALTAAENRKRETQLAVDIEDLSREYGYKVNTNFTALGSYSGNTSNNVYSNDLSKNDIQKLIRVKLEDQTFNLENAEELQSIGLDEKTIELITSNEKLREEIIKLTNATKDASEAYEVDVANDLIAAGLNLDSIAEEYRSGILSQISQDTLDKKDTYKDVILSDEGLIGGKDADQWIQEYLDYHGYSGNAREDGVKDWFNSNDTLTTFKKDENGNRTEEKITIDKDSIAEWAALMQAETEALNMNLEQYQALIARSEEAWNAADNLIAENNNVLSNLNELNTLKTSVLDPAATDNIEKNYEQSFEANKQDFADLVGLNADSNVLKETFGDADWVIDHLEDIQDALNGDAEALNRLRQEVRDTNEYIQETSKSWYDSSDAAQDYFKIMESANKPIKGTEEWRQVFVGLQQSLSDNADELSNIAGLAPEVFKRFIQDADYAAIAANAFKKAAEGDTKALVDLRKESSNKIIAEFIIDIEDQKIKNHVQELHDSLQTILLDPITAEIDLDSEDFLNTCNEMIAAAGLTAEQAQAYFASMGYNAKVTVTEVDGEKKSTQEWLKLDPEATKKANGVPQFTKEKTDLISTFKTEVPVIESITPDGTSNGGNIDVIARSENTPTDTGSGSAGNGSGDDYVPEIDRNHEIKRVISDLEDSYNRLAIAKDRAYGANHINLIDKEISQTNELIEAQQALLAEHEMYLAQDKAKVLALFPHAQFDDQGNISNYNALRMQTTSEEQVEILDQYEETLDEIKETREAIRDLQYQIQDLNFEKLQYELEYKVEISDDALKKLDYFANKFSNNVYQSVESLVINYEEGEEYSNILELNKDFVSKLDENFEQNKISQADYIEGLRQAREATLEQLNNLLALDEEMQVFYGETLESTNEELEKYTSRLEHTSNVLDHYLNLVDLLGKSKDYELIGDLQEKKVQSALNLFEISKSNYETLAKEKEALQASLDEAKSKVDQNKVQNLEKQLDEAKTSLDNTKKKITELENLEEVEDEEAHQKEIEELKTQKEKLTQDILDFSSQIAEENAPVDFLKGQLEDITEAYEMSYEEMLDALTEYLETYKEKVETTFDSISATLEKSLTGGVGFDRMLDDFEMLDRQQEEFLTKTNQIYETNKLIRTANQEIEKIDNEIAKKKLRSYVEETKNLQNNNKLSKYELDVQQAKYDLLLAEIALEEARNAKSQVSLVRDSEGNFGYAYTVDQDEISKAEQAYEDAQNKLYNISYDGQQEYTEKFLSALQEYSEKQNQMAKDYLDGEYENREAFNEDLARLEEQYRGDNGILTIYSDLANMASKVDINALIENHRGQYLNKALGFESFDEAFVEANENISKTADDLDNTLTEVETMMQTTLISSDQLIKNSNKLTEEVKNEVIPELANERKEVIELTKEYSNLRQELLEYIRDFEGLLFGANGIDDKIKKQSENVENKESILTYEGRTISIPGVPTSIPTETYQKTEGSNYDPANDPKNWELHGNEWMYLNPETNQYEWKAANPYNNYSNDWSIYQSTIQDTLVKKQAEKYDRYIEKQQQAWNDYQKENPIATEGQANNVKYHPTESNPIVRYINAGRDKIAVRADGTTEYIGAFSSGGYTGDWGPEGKLAVLHQKELVLKPSDTENILSAVSIIRDISNTIDRYASISRAIGLSLAPNIHTTESTVEQNVKIEATFPNVSNHSEIEEAFNNLVNEAAQYAYRKK